MQNHHEMMEVKEAAAFLKVHPETLRRLARSKKIPAFKVGTDWRFSREALRRWADQHHHQRQPFTVLVVDDDAGLRGLLRDFLTGAGCACLQVESAEDALPILKSTHINLVLLDLKLPGMNGAELLMHMKDQGYVPPVIVITGYPDSELLAGAMGYGSITLMSKPIKWELLTKLLQQLRRNHAV